MLVCVTGEMALKIFLTGERQIGKSTIIKKVLSGIEGTPLGGYFTRAVDADIYMYPACDEKAPGVLVGRKHQGGFTDVFDKEGAAILRKSTAANLVILDEIGWMEADADAFSTEILKIVSSEQDVLGVLRKDCDTKLCHTLRALPAVELITVTEENRDELALILSERFKEGGASLNRAD